MVIADPCVVTLIWTMADAQGTTLDELAEPTEFFFGGNDLLARIEEVLAGQTEGYETLVRLEPEQAFGEYRSELVCFEQRSLFPPHIEAGMQFDGLPEGAITTGMPVDTIFTITEIYPDHVVLDGNHPLAGMALQLDLKVVGVRAASAEELHARSVADETIALTIASPGSSQLH